MLTRVPFRVFSTTIGVLVGIASLGVAQTTFETRKIISSDLEGDDYFGVSVDIDGDRMIVGSGRADVATDPTSDEGLAYIYDWDGTAWVETAILAGIGVNPNSEFGFQVGLEGDFAVAGAPSFEVIDDVTGFPFDHSGAVFVFQFDGLAWNQIAQLTAEIPEADQHFGTAMAISQDRIVVGAPGAEIHHEESAFDGVGEGVVYVFQFDGLAWNLEADFAASDAGIGYEFGSAVDIDMSRQRLVVGANHDLGPTNDVNAGAIYIFELIGAPAAEVWTEVVKLIPSNLREYDHFGGAVAISGNRVIAGSRYSDLNAFSNSNEGHAYVWHLQNNVWNMEGDLFPSSIRAGDLFGGDVAIDGDVAIIGAHRHDRLNDPNSDEGIAYIYAFDGSAWVELEQIGASDVVPGSIFGRAVDIDGERIMAGSAVDFAGAALAGGVYEYERDPNLGQALAYNGSGVNSEAFTSDNRPILGVNWNAQVDTSDFPLASQSFLFIYAAPFQLLIAQGELLIDPTSPSYGLSLVISGSGSDAHAIAIPNDPSLIGFPAYIQGAIGDGALHLLSAYALTLGL